MIRSLGKLFSPPPLKVDDDPLGAEAFGVAGPLIPQMPLLAEPVVIAEGPSAVDGWCLPDELPQSEPNAAWLDDVGYLPFAVDPVRKADPDDLLEASLEEAQLSTLAQSLYVPPAVAPAIIASVPVPEPVVTTAPVAPPVIVVHQQEAHAASFLDQAPLDSVVDPEPTPDPWLSDGLDVPQLTTATGRGWLGLVAAGLAILSAAITIIVAG